MLEEKDEKDGTPERVWQWPPPRRAACVPMPYYLIGVEPVPEEERTVLPEGEDNAGREEEKWYTVVRVVNGEFEYLIGTTKYVDALEAILQDSLVAIFKATPRLMAEAMRGEARWTYNQACDDEEENYAYKSAPQPPYFEGNSGTLFPDFKRRPDAFAEPRAEEKPAEVTVPAADNGMCPIHNITKRRNGCIECRRDNRGRSSGVRNPICPRHGQKTKDGMKGGHQKYRCLPCLSEQRTSVPLPDDQPRPQTTRSKAQPNGRKAALARLMRNNPKCMTCREHLRKSKPHTGVNGKTIQYYKPCVNGCFVTGHEAPNAKVRLPDDFEQVLPIVEKYVKRSGIYVHTQNLRDVVQTVSLLLWQRAIRPTDLVDKARLRDIINNEVKGYQSEYAPRNGGTSQSLDAPVREDLEGSAALSEFTPAPEAESDPHQQLEAKEVIEARLREQPVTPPDELITPAIEGARGADRANGHNPQQEKFERLSLGESMRGKDEEDDEKTEDNELESSSLNPEEELIAKEASAGEE